MLVSRVAYLIKKKNISPRSILAVTFTKKASREMKNRLEYLLRDANDVSNLTSEQSIKSVDNPNEKDDKITEMRGGRAVVTCTTLHSFCCGVLRTYTSERDFTLYDTSACKKIVKDLLKEADKGETFEDTEYIPSDVYNALSTIKRQMLKRIGFQFDDRVFEKADSILHDYNQVLKRNNALDFDDLILETLKLMLMNGRAARAIRSRYKHIFCDEWQDVDKSQYSLLLILLDPSSRKLHFGSDIDNYMKANKISDAGRESPIEISEDTDNEVEGDDSRTFFVVGDTKQTIFSWRGADNRNLNYFAEDIPS